MKTKKMAILSVAVLLCCAAFAIYFGGTRPGARNKAFAPFAGHALDDTLFGVWIYSNPPGDLNVAEVNLFEFSGPEFATYLCVVPRYAASSIKIEEMGIDLERSTFVPTSTLRESAAAEDYALVVRTHMPEGGPQLRITITHDGRSATYEPVYDGQGDTVYPVIKNGYILDKK